MLGFSPLADNSIAGFDTLNSTVTGVQATGAVGTVSVDTEISVTGVQATSAVGSIPSISAEISVTGVVGTGRIGQAFPWNQIKPSQNSNFSGIKPSQTPSWTNIAA